MTNRRLIPCVELKQVNLAEELASKCMERDIRPFAACLDGLDAGASIEPLCKELAQTAAMCIRCLVHLEGR